MSSLQSQQQRQFHFTSADRERSSKGCALLQFAALLSPQEGPAALSGHGDTEELMDAGELSQAGVMPATCHVAVNTT